MKITHDLESNQYDKLRKDRRIKVLVSLIVISFYTTRLFVMEWIVLLSTFAHHIIVLLYYSQFNEAILDHRVVHNHHKKPKICHPTNLWKQILIGLH